MFIILLAGVEGVLRFVGFGYSTGFFEKVRVGRRVMLEDNPRFSLRFFPPNLARTAGPIRISAVKPPGVYRIFILGESAAMGDPEPAYGAGRYFQVLLEERYPGRRFEVVNTGITAIDSHVILPIARDCARADGDLWIVYMGNNEMVGPFGAATVFGSQAAPLFFARMNLAIQTTRVGQLTVELMRKFGSKTSQAPSWMGMEMFTRNRVLPGDPRRETVYRNFQANLRDILQCGVHSGAAVLLSTVAVNLKDCPPFASVAETNLPPSDREEFDRYYSAALDEEAKTNFAVAAEDFDQAVRVAPQSADAQYRYGECLLRMKNAAARGHLQLACDADALPFRTDSKENRIIRDAGRAFAGRGVWLVDAAADLESNAPGGVLGDETFYEHVHFNFDGNYRLARIWAAQIAPLLPESISATAEASWASQETCERRLALTDWNRNDVLRDVIRRLGDAPLNSQPNNGARVAALEVQLRAVQARMDAAGARSARDIYDAALKRAPDDNYLHEDYADFLMSTHDRAGATAEWRKVHELIPDDYLANFRLGGLLADQGKTGEAAACLGKAVELRPDLGDAWFELGEVHATQHDYKLALTEYARARQLRPGNPDYDYYSGMALLELKRAPEAVEAFRRAIADDTNYWEAHFALGGQLGLSGQIAGAQHEFEEVVRLKPAHAGAHLNLGVALMKEGRLEAAAAQYEQTLQLDPGNQIARQYLAEARRLQNRVK